MSDILEHFDDRFKQMIDDCTDSEDFASNEAQAKMKTLKIFSECRPSSVQPEQPEAVVPTTRWGKFVAGTSRVWDNETTRVLIKAGGAFAGVAVVAYSTIHKDHVMERQALAQANQRSV